jgi:death-on-curing protein
MSPSQEPIWLTYEQAIAIHSRQLRRFGGAPGLRDEGLLRSALQRPMDKWHYTQADIPTLAAAYGFGLAKNHPFVDGNKRMAFLSLMTFLRRNGVRFAPDQAQATAIVVSLASGQISEDSLVRWIRDNWPS